MNIIKTISVIILFGWLLFSIPLPIITGLIDAYCCVKNASKGE